ncbi:MAG: hypothetical protein MK086_05125 [Flavobacteriales bacterium]|nr:hypothetical protein [Flavobacteriales bacterium]
MDTLVEALIGAIPALIIAGLVIYIFHESMRFITARDRKMGRGEKRISLSSGENVTAENSFVSKLRLQAAERFVLFLERIEPGRLVMRTHQNGMSAKMLQNEILKSIREEFDHNLSQQIYISENSWNLIKGAKDEMVKFITATGDGMKPEATALDFSRKMFEAASKVEKLPGDVALEYLRKETNELF